MRQQAGRCTLTSRAFQNDQMGPFLEKLCNLVGYDKALPMNTGAEAVETAIKTARKWGYKVKGVAENAAEVIVCSDNFHGRTTTIVGFSTEEQYKDGFGPFTPGFKVVRYGDLPALEAAINDNSVGFLVEPIQGEGGVIVPPDGYLSEAAQLCADNNVAFIADEIQTGLGRTGRLLCSDWDRIRPDILILGKALGGGVYPVSAVCADDGFMEVYNPGDHGSTFGGNPLGAAVAMTALDVILDENLAEKAEENGDWFMNELRTIDSPHVVEGRGKGLLIGVVISDESGPANPFCKALQKRGILAKETHEQVIRFAPPLVITRETLKSVLPDISSVLSGEGLATP
jgi:ornithine--oxo-acid transaminase